MNKEEIALALETVHNPRSASQDRFRAQEILERVKQDPLCAVVGFELNAEPGSNEYVKHYGLALLEHAVKYQFNGYDEAQRAAVKTWVVQLAYGVKETDARFVREKTAYIYETLAKKLWGIDTERANSGAESSNPGEPAALTAQTAPTGWPEFDAQLLEMWLRGGVHEEFALSVLKTLFEDVFLLDDPVASGRMHVLSTQCIEIVASKQDLSEIYAAKSPELETLRASPTNEGWLLRWTSMLQTLHSSPNTDAKRYANLLETVKTSLEWVPVVSLLSSNVMRALVQAITHADVRVRVLACECLHILLHTRSYSAQTAFDSVVGSVFQPDGQRWLAEVYLCAAKRLQPGADEESEYTFLKKLVELVAALGEFVLSPKHGKLPDSADVKAYYSLMLEICTHPSLVVSGQALQFWCGVLRVEPAEQALESVYMRLLQCAAQRCIAYELGPPPPFLHADFDAGQDAAQFCRSYRRYMEDTLRLVVCRAPVLGMQFLRARVAAFFGSPEGLEALSTDFTAQKPQKGAAYIECLAQYTCVEAAIRGASRWQVWAEKDAKQQLEPEILQYMAEWAVELLEIRPADLDLQRRGVECLVQFAPLLKQAPQVLFKVLERVLESCTHALPPERPEFDLEREKVMELRLACGTELNRLAYMVPNELGAIYTDLERVIAQLIEARQVKEHESVSFKSFLLVTSQRSNMLDKQTKFEAIVDPVLQRWTDPATIKGLESLEWFLERVGVVEIDKYFRSRSLASAARMLDAPIDDAGRQLKTELKQKWQAVFPIRPSRIFIQYTIERLDHQSQEFQYLLNMWKPRVQAVLPHVLQLVMQIMAYHDPANWRNLPSEVQSFLKASCYERFWQAGVSMQTKAEFESANEQASKTLRDFADSVGHVVRYTREYAFLTLGSISQLEETMYEVPQMGLMLAKALTSTIEGVTCHAWRHMVSLVIRPVLKNCPTQYMNSFYAEFVPPVLATLNTVLRNMWSKQESLGLQLLESMNLAHGDDELSEEMMQEYLLRQLTAIVDRLLIDLVGQSSARSGERAVSDGKDVGRSVCRSTPGILVEVVKLCAQLMGYKDSRCCFNTCLIVRHLFTWQPDSAMSSETEQMFVQEIAPACLRILNDPFFQESHLEAGTILTLMHAQFADSAQPLALVAQLVNAPQQDVQTLLASLGSAKSLRQQRGVLMEFLVQCRVLQPDEQTRARSRKRLEQRVSVRNVAEEHYDSEALMNMFNI